MNTSANTTKLKSLFFNEADEIFILTDEHLNIIDVNDTFVKKIKIKREYLIGKNMLDINPDLKNTKRYKKYKEVLKTGKTITVNDVKINPSLGFKNKVAQIRIFKLKKGLAITVLDTTNLANSKKNLQKAKEELTKTAEAKKVDFEQKLEETISNMSYKADDIISALEKKLADLKNKNAQLQK